jgi:signal peptidase
MAPEGPDASDDAGRSADGPSDRARREPTDGDRSTDDRQGSTDGDDDTRRGTRRGEGGDRDGAADAGRVGDATAAETETGTGGPPTTDERERPGPPPGEGTDPPAPAGDAEETIAGPVEVVVEVARSVGMVLLVGGLLFAASGVWPPLVAVESGSMEPHMFRGDLVFVTEEGRYSPNTAVEGVVTYQQGRETGYRSFGDYGNVVVYQPNGDPGTPVIHRAYLYVEAGENWVAQADPQYLGGATTCAEVATCPAPHDGFITRGDDNPRYDQVGRTESSVLSTVVRPEWVRGNAKVRVPKLGCVRLELSGIDCGPLIR